MEPIIVKANSDSELLISLVSSGALELTEIGMMASDGVVYSRIGNLNGEVYAMLELSQCLPEKQLQISQALKSISTNPGEPVRITLGGTVPVRAVSPSSWRLALIEFGLDEQVDALISQAGKEAKVLYEFSNKVLRNHPLIQTLAEALGKTNDDIEQVFLRAEELDRQ